MLVSTLVMTMMRQILFPPFCTRCKFRYLFLQYICENHFQRLSRRSLFTNLKAANHFGRPDLASFLKFVQKKHSYVSQTFFLPSLRSEHNCRHGSCSTSEENFLPFYISFYLPLRSARSECLAAGRPPSRKPIARPAKRSTSAGSCPTSRITLKILAKRANYVHCQLVYQ